MDERRHRIRRIAVPLLQAAVTGLLLYFLFRNAEMRSGVARLFGEGNPLWIGAGLLAVGASIAANVARWRIFLSIQGIHVPYPRLGGIFLVGSFFNLFLPGVVGGEVLNALYLMRSHPGRRGAIVLSIAADHLSGLLALTAAAAIFATSRSEAFLANPIAASAFWFMWIAIGLTLLALAASFLATHRRTRHLVPKRLLEREVFKRLCGVHDLITGHWRQAALACGISFFILFAYFGSYYCAGRAFGVPASLLDIFAVMPAVDVAAMIPVSISGLGVREVLMIELLDALASVPADQAVTLSLAGFGLTVAWGLTGGAFFPFLKVSSSAGTGDSAEETPEQAEPPPPGNP